LVLEEERDDAGRGGAHEPFGRLHGRERGTEVLDVSLRRARVAHADGAVARGRLASRAARIAEYAAGHPREVDEILVLQRVARAAEAGEPILHVGRVARLAELAVAHHVDAGLHLL